tara:strand:- start:80 stop:268 length:189 start_codon:yes stop_codon:yes gene_type:complete
LIISGIIIKGMRSRYIDERKPIYIKIERYSAVKIGTVILSFSFHGVNNSIIVDKIAVETDRK